MSDHTTSSHKDIHKPKKALLEWYDAHRRILPWRALPGHKADPYHVWLSEIMLQQTTVQAVIPYFLKFLDHYPTIHDLANAPQDDVLAHWAGLGYYARARNLHKCAKVISEEQGGKFPQTQSELKKLPGIGDYTSAAIMCIAFNKHATVVDGNVERVMSRLFKIEEELPGSKPIIKEKAALFFNEEHDRPGDLVQAMMDLGATICTPKNPKCMLCPIRTSCDAYTQNSADSAPKDYPRKKPKQKIPQKHGFVYVLKHPKKGIALEKRPEQGMLAEMMGLPTSEWILKNNKIKHLQCFKDKKLKKNKKLFITHVFTHFKLKLYIIEVNDDDIINKLPKPYFWSDDMSGLPTLFQKVIKQIKIK